MTLFPTALFDNSILTSILVGLVVVWILQETLGWNSTGLVVPGYLASVFVLQPSTALVMVAEAVTACLLARAVTHNLPHWLPFAPPFGRDRFFLLLVLSVGVRILFEAGGMEAVLPGIQHDLYSMGLVIVPLAANGLWRTGLVHGAVQIGIPTVVTFAVLRLLLLPLTNLDLTDFELSYEDVAQSFEASPKAYILVLAGAWLGSQFNLRYGWDFGGLIVPGLLALCWLTPLTVAATLVEALIIALLTLTALKLPGLRDANLSGGRPLVLAFFLGFALKYAVAWISDGLWPGLSIRSLFGFGYLLPAIIALRVVKYRDPFRVVVPTAFVSLLAFGLGSVAGFGLERLSSGPAEAVDAELTEGWEGVDPLVAAWMGGEQRTGRPSLSGGASWHPDGPGAARIVEDGPPYAMLATDDDELLLEATAFLSEALNPGASYLCTGGRSRCSEAEEALAFRRPVVRVTAAQAGADSRLLVERRPPEGLDLGALTGILPTLVLVQERGPARLELSEADRWRLAQASCQVEDVPAPQLSEALPSHPALSHSARDRRVLTRAVIPHLMRWQREERPDRSETSLCLGRSAASALGLSVGPSDGEVTLEGAGWRLVLSRQASGGMVWAPFSGDEPGTEAVAASMFRAQDLAVFLSTNPSPLDAPYERDGESAYLATAVVPYLAPRSVLTTVRGIRDGYDLGARVVGSHGTPVHSTAQSFAIEPDAWVRGEARQLAFYDPSNPIREVAHWLDLDHTTLFVDSRVRQNLEPLSHEHVLHTLLPRVPTAWDDLLTHASVDPPSDEYAWLDTSVQRALEDSRPDWVALIREAERRRTELSLVCESLLGCRWLRLRDCDDTGCRGILKTLAVSDTPPPEGLHGRLALGGPALSWSEGP